MARGFGKTLNYRRVDPISRANSPHPPSLAQVGLGLSRTRQFVVAAMGIANGLWA